jgi:phosphatidylglycerol:prolipoprotein diacylglycerol transferase
MRSVLFHFFGLPVYSYGLMFAVAFSFAVWHITRLGRSEGVKPVVVHDSAVAAMLAAFGGARLTHVIIEWQYFRHHPAEILQIWKGGLVFYGGLIACLIVVPFVFRAHGVTFWKIADCFTPATALGHGFVRFGCFLNGCCHGRPADWGVVFPELRDNTPRQPSQLYEAAIGVIFFFLTLYIHKRRRFRGQTFLSYLLLYAVARFTLEFTRGDTERGRAAGLWTSQWIAIVIFVAGAGAWWWRSRTARMSPEESAGGQAAPST